MQQISFRAMGCQMLAVVDSDAPGVGDQLAQAPGWFEAWEQYLSRFREDSELSRLNRSQGQSVRVSRVLWDAVGAALEAAEQSGGLVTPTLLDAIEAAGYDETFESVARRDAGQHKTTSRPAGVPQAAWRAIQRDQRARSIRLPEGLRLDLGGSAKGWSAARAAERLRASGPALVDAGGDIAVSGPMADGSRWPVGIGDPRDPDASLGLLMIDRGGVATSGRDYRRWQRDGVWQHHILDPRTGVPAQTDVLSATVVGPSALDAEVAAKAALILGSQDGMAWIEARPALAALLVLEDGRGLCSRRLRDYLYEQ